MTERDSHLSRWRALTAENLLNDFAHISRRLGSSAVAYDPGRPYDQAECNELRAELLRRLVSSETRPSEDAKDAARYRWLRIHGAALAGSEHFKQELVRRCINLDEEIDAAMEKSNVLR